MADGGEVVDGRKGRYYRITEAGLEVLRPEVARPGRNIGVARRQLGAGSSLGRRHVSVEDQFRWLARLYPADCRERNEEDLISTLLDSTGPRRRLIPVG